MLKMKILKRDGPVQYLNIPHQHFLRAHLECGIFMCFYCFQCMRHLISITPMLKVSFKNKFLNLIKRSLINWMRPIVSGTNCVVSEIICYRISCDRTSCYETSCIKLWIFKLWLFNLFFSFGRWKWRFNGSSFNRNRIYSNDNIFKARNGLSELKFI